MGKSSTGSSWAGVLGGFVTGSVVTCAAMMYVLYKKRLEDEEIERQLQEQAAEEAERGILTKAGTSSRSLSKSLQALDPSSLLAGAAAGNASEGFFSDLIRQMWDEIDVAASKMIRESLEPIFVGLPSPLNSLRFTTCSLGRDPIRFENIIVHEKDKDHHEAASVVQFDMDLVWNGNVDLQLKADYIGSFGICEMKLYGHLTFLIHPINEMPVVSAVQYGFINPPTLKLDFTGLANLADMKFLKNQIISTIVGGLDSMILPNRSIFKMDPNLDVKQIVRPPKGIARVRIVNGRGFQLEKRMLRQHDIPDVYCITTLGSSQPWRSSTIDDRLNPEWSWYEFGDFVYCDYNQILTVHVWDEDDGSMDGDDELGMAKITLGQILLSGQRQVTLDLLDVSSKDMDGLQTGASITIQVDVFPFAKKPTATAPLSKQLFDDVVAKANKETAEAVKSILAPEPVSSDKKKKKAKPKSDAKKQAKAISALPKNRIIGGLGICVLRAYGLPLEPEKASSYVKTTVKYGNSTSKSDGSKKDDAAANNMEFVTCTVIDGPGIDALNPIYDGVFFVPVTCDMISVTGKDNNSTIPANGSPDWCIEFALMNGPGEETDQVLGTSVVKHNDLIAAPNMTIDEKTVVGKPEDAAIEYFVAFRYVIEGANSALTASLQKSAPFAESLKSSGASNPVNIVDNSIGSIRITVLKGFGFKIPKKKVFRIKADIPDPYCKISFGGASNPQIFRTSVKKNNINPEWNESSPIYPLRDHGEMITVEVWEHNSGSKDEFIGSGRIAVGKLLLADATNAIEGKEIEIMGKGNQTTGIFIIIKCEMIPEV